MSDTTTEAPIVDFAHRKRALALKIKERGLQTHELMYVSFDPEIAALAQQIGQRWIKLTGSKHGREFADKYVADAERVVAAVLAEKASGYCDCSTLLYTTPHILGEDNLKCLTGSSKQNIRKCDLMSLEKT